MASVIRNNLDAILVGPICEDVYVWVILTRAFKKKCCDDSFL